MNKKDHWCFHKQIPDQVWDDASTWESGEREEVFALQKPPPSPENISVVIPGLTRNLIINGIKPQKSRITNNK